MKVAVYSVLGWAIALSLVLSLYAATRLSVDPALIAILQVPIAAAIGGARKWLGFRAEKVGLTLPDIIDPTGGNQT